MKQYKKNRISQFFTLIELIVVMAIFVVLLVVVIRFYNSAHKASSRIRGQAMIFENAKIALDLMTRDIQCIYYENGIIPFWHWQPPNKANPPADWGNEFLAFVAATSMPANDDCTSKLSEIKYQKYYSADFDEDNDGWLRRSVTGNKLDGGVDNPRWNYYNNLLVGNDTYLDADDIPVAAFTAISGTSDTSSNDSYQKVIPYVTDLSFKCYDQGGVEIDPDETTATGTEYSCYDVDHTFPFSIEITLKLMDKNSWLKWIELNGDANTTDSGSVKEFRQKHERVFNKTVLIGNRGQYD